MVNDKRLHFGQQSIPMFQLRRNQAAWGVLWLLLAATGCNSDTEYVTVEGFAMPIQPQESVERRWQQVSLRQLYELPRESGIYLYRRGPITIGSDGALYYRDPGDMKVKHFDADGFFKHSYGGLGEGPGEFRMFMDADIMGDSVLYVTDNERQTISFFAVDSSTFLYSIPRVNGYRYRITRSGRAYWLTVGGDSLLGTSVGEHDTRFIGTMIEGQTAADRLHMLMGGRIVTYQEDVIYIPNRYPILMRFDSTGTVIYARATPDFENADPPGVERFRTSSGFGIRVVGRSVSGATGIYGDKLVVFVYDAFDVYNAATGDYEYSVSVPWKRTSHASYDPMRKRVWQVRDTTVVVYAVDPPDMALGNAHSQDPGPESLPPQ